MYQSHCSIIEDILLILTEHINMRIPKEKQYPNVPISIILLTCNRKDNARITINELYKRVKYSDKIHLIVVDDESTDGTLELLREKKKEGKIDVLIESKNFKNVSLAYNEGFKYVKSDYFICTQDDITPPKLEPKDVIEQLQDLMEKYPDHGGIGCRIERIQNMHWEEGDLSRARKSLAAYFRIQTKEDYEKMGMLPSRDWDDVAFLGRVRKVLKKECSWSTHLWASHARGYGKDRGYLVLPKKWGIGIHSRDKQDYERKPYPEIDPITNVPLKLLKK